MEAAEWIRNATIAVLGVAATGTLTALLWLMKLGNRVTALETRMSIMEQAQKDAHQETLAGLRAIREEARLASTAIAQAREDALRFFAPNDDMKRLEDKVDGVRDAVNKLGVKTPARKPARKRDASE